MKYRYTILYVSDVPATLSFYEAAFGLTLSMLHEAGDYGELNSGDTKLAFSSLDLMKSMAKEVGDAREQPPCFELAFETNDVPAAVTRAREAGATLVQDATAMPWGQTISYVKDINGFLVEICTPVQIDSGEV